MANPVKRSVTSTYTDTDASSVTITKPTGLAEDDLMIAYVSIFNAGSDRTITTLAGWTKLTEANSSDRRVLACYYKIATAGDVAASNFTWSFSGGVDKLGGAMYAFTGYAEGSPITIFEQDLITPSSATITATTALTPAVAESYVITAYMPTDAAAAAILTASAFTLTPTTTLTEDVDTGVRDGGSTASSLIIASAEYNGLTEITSRSVTISESITGATPTIALLVNAPQNASADVSHLSITPTIESITGSNTATATISMADLSPTLTSLASKSSSDGTNWNNDTLPTTNWSNEI